MPGAPVNGLGSATSVSGGGIIDGASVSPVGSSGIGGGSSLGGVGVNAD